MLGLFTGRCRKRKAVNMTEQLKPLPCPFCGGTDIRAHVYGGGEPDAFMQCHDCSADGPNGLNRAGAIEAWNRRAQPAPITPETGNKPDQGASAITSESGKAGQVLSDAAIKTAAIEAFDCCWDSDDETLVNKYGHGVYLWRFIDFARAIEQAVLAKRVPMERGWMCLTDFQHELGAAAGGVTIYPSLEDLKANRTCWEQCGVIEVGIVGEKGGE